MAQAGMTPSTRCAAMTAQVGPFDTLDLETLRARGGAKWDIAPEHLGAFIAEMDFPHADVVTQALHECVARGDFGYMYPKAHRALAQACTGWISARYGWDVAADYVYPVADVLRVLEICIQFFTAPDSAVIVPTPAYPPFLTIPQTWDRQIVEAPFVSHDRGWTLDLDEVAAAFAAGAELLVLCNPVNPLGKVYGREELNAVTAVVDRYGGRVFADEIHAPLVYASRPDGSTASPHVPYASTSDVAARHTLTGMSASKAWNMPGLKCAQVIFGNRSDLDHWRRVDELSPYGAATPGAWASAAAYATGGPWLDDLLGYLDENRRQLGALVDDLLPGVGYRVPDATYLAWLDFTGTPLVDSPAAHMKAHAKVLLSEGVDFGRAGAGWLRLNFATTHRILADIVRAMGEALPT
jgi:cysteine-S-conjugate beta-lyase